MIHISLVCVVHFKIKNKFSRNYRSYFLAHRVPRIPQHIHKIFAIAINFTFVHSFATVADGEM